MSTLQNKQVNLSLFVLLLVVLTIISQQAIAAPRIYLKISNKDIHAIVIADEPTGAAEWAAEELQRYLLRITGKNLPILRESKYVNQEPAILVGISRVTRSQGVDEKMLKKTLKPEGFIIKTTKDYVIIVGDDHPVFKAEYFRTSSLTNVDNLTIAEQVDGTRYGTLYGIYTFLEQIAGVSWFFPGELGEVVPEDMDVSIPEIDQNDSPDFSMRKLTRLDLTDSAQLGIMLPEYQEEFLGEIRQLYPVRSRLQQLSWKYYAEHSMIKWGERFGKDHQEYFALVNGKRTNDWGWGENKSGLSEDHFRYGTHRSFCWANPATIAQQIKEMRIFFNKDKEQPLLPGSILRYAYPIIPNDGIQNICECEFCRKFHTPERPYRGSMSDLYAYHLSEVAKVAAKEFPNRYILGMAYGATVLPPVNVKLPPNVIMSLASVGGFIFALYHPETKNWNDDWVESWRKHAEVPVIWLYLERLRNKWKHLPLTLVHALGEEIKSRKGKVGGYYWCFNSSDVNIFFTLELYVGTQLMWDADQDVDTLIDRFMQKLYGPAAEPVKKLYLYLENLFAQEVKTYALGMSPDSTGLPIPDWKSYPTERLFNEVYTPENLKKALLLVEQAEAKCSFTKHDVLKGNESMKRAERVRRLKEALLIAFAESVLKNSSSTVSGSVDDF